MNVRGVKPGVRLVEVMTVAKLLPLLMLRRASAIWFVNPEYLRWPAVPAASARRRTAIVLIFAFVGLEIALVPSGEVRDPTRTVPRALFLALAIDDDAVSADPDSGAGHARPVDLDICRRAARRSGGRASSAAADACWSWPARAISMFGYVSGDMLGSPRALFAFARDGILPAAVARIHPRFHTPYIAIMLYAASSRRWP